MMTKGTLLERVLMAFALAAPVSIAVAEPLAYLAVPIWLWGAVRDGRRGPASPYLWPILFFIAAVALAAAFGLRPMHSFRKMDRLFLLGVVFIIPAVCAVEGPDQWKLLQRMAALFVVGATMKAFYDVVRIPLLYWMAPVRVDENGMSLLYKLGNMREPQMYMVALCFVVGALVHGAWKDRRALVWVSLVLLVAAFVLHFKRGAWLAFGLTAFLLAVLAGNRKLFATLGFCFALLLAIPQTRERMATVSNEFSYTMGGRLLLWTHAAPRLIAANPTGLGWRAIRHEDLRGASRHVQRGLNHLHTNVLQVVLELGWLGLAAWFNWMGMGLYVMWTNVRRTRSADPGVAAVALGTLGAFCALHFNGLVEYNFGDGEIFMVFAFLMGLSAVVWGREERNAT